MKGLLCVLAMTVLLPACKSRSNEFKGPKIKSIVRGNSKKSLVYHYDEQGRISYTEVGSKIDSRYVYAGNIVTSTKCDTNGIVLRADTFFLDKNGLADSITAFHLPPGLNTNINRNATDDSVIRFHTYGVSHEKIIRDKDGYVTKIYMYNDNHIDSLLFTISNGNIIAGYSGGNKVYSYYDYYTEYMNTTAINNEGQFFMYKNPRNPVKTLVDIGPDHDTLRIHSFRYDYDEEGRTVRMLVLNKTDTINQVFYTYY